MSPNLHIFLLLVGTTIVPSFSQDETIKAIKKKVHVTDILSANTTQFSSNLRNGILSTCGGVHTSTSATISYKNGATISPNERCVWVINPAGSSNYSLSVATLGLQIQTGVTGITASCFNMRGSTAFSSVAITRTGTVSLPSVCHSLVITFYSGPNVGTSRGFSLSYSRRTANGLSSGSSRNYILNAAQQQIRHPANADTQYTNKELTLFAFPPPNNVYSSARKTLVTYMQVSLERTSCWDRIHAYRFRPSGWTVLSELCGDVEFKQWTDADVILVTFTSDGSVLGRGFHILRTNLPL
ncbi:unnamed protein product [Orchesella dallaii]|uniref:Cubilin n=1 Tax=Orchesella dallaii TaxID=48710 RepID=A0ABP1RV59_9HEXA